MDRLIKILKKYNSEVDYTTNDHLIDDEIFDSFDIVSIVSDIDVEFDVEITTKDIIPENFNSASNLYALIKRLED